MHGYLTCIQKTFLYQSERKKYWNFNVNQNSMIKIEMKAC